VATRPCHHCRPAKRWNTMRSRRMGPTRTLASKVGLNDAAALLSRTEDEKNRRRKLTEIAAACTRPGANQEEEVAYDEFPSAGLRTDENPVKGRDLAEHHLLGSALPSRGPCGVPHCDASSRNRDTQCDSLNLSDVAESCLCPSTVQRPTFSRYGFV